MKVGDGDGGKSNSKPVMNLLEFFSSFKCLRRTRCIDWDGRN